MSIEPDSVDSQVPSNTISALAVGGFKSLAEKQWIEILPLTLLAGTNSSGKSSIMQPLLLLKQTLEAPYDPGPLLLNGPNVKFTDASQILARTASRTSSDAFSIDIVEGDGDNFTLYFSATKQGGVDLVRLTATLGYEELNLTPGMSDADIAAALPVEILSKAQIVSGMQFELLQWQTIRVRCFLEARMYDEMFGRYTGFRVPDTSAVAAALRAIIHVPGLRGNPERTYKTTAVGGEFPGTFDNYVASVIAQWQAQRDPRLERLSQDLAEVGLTTSVEAAQLDSTQVEIRVARVARKKGSKRADMVSIADVGFGVSQTLPVLVALLVAQPGQLVYIEQPELHLHPRAQAALAPILARATTRGIKVVVETHSALLLRAVQTLVARGELATNLVKLHWFQRGDDGATAITSADLDEDGAFGAWPEDFDDVILQTEAAYLDAVTLRS
jgi:predicted ATPase